MPLSSNSLFHFTKEKESLLGILTENFKICYSMEHLDTRTGWADAAYPMVCFCDIPLSQVQSHREMYGHYGIGLKKEWAISKGLNPVLYIEKNSSLGGVIKPAMLKVERMGKDYEDIMQAFISEMRYMKNYEGTLKKADGTYNENYRFYDEREWRYVPPIAESEPFISKLDFIKRRDKFIDKLRLEFTPNDITSIIIKSDSEISEFVNILREVKKKKYLPEDIEILTTRIITSEQMDNDF